MAHLCAEDRFSIKNHNLVWYLLSSWLLVYPVTMYKTIEALFDLAVTLALCFVFKAYLPEDFESLLIYLWFCKHQDVFYLHVSLSPM